MSPFLSPQSVHPRALHGGGSSPFRSAHLAARRAARMSFWSSLPPVGVCIPRRHRRQLHPFMWLPIADLRRGRTILHFPARLNFPTGMMPPGYLGIMPVGAPAAD